jgi:hypothetical protein
MRHARTVPTIATIAAAKISIAAEIAEGAVDLAGAGQADDGEAVAVAVADDHRDPEAATFLHPNMRRVAISPAMIHAIHAGRITAAHSPAVLNLAADSAALGSTVMTIAALKVLASMRRQRLRIPQKMRFSFRANLLQNIAASPLFPRRLLRPLRSSRSIPGILQKRKMRPRVLP